MSGDARRDDAGDYPWLDGDFDLDGEEIDDSEREKVGADDDWSDVPGYEDDDDDGDETDG
jgi:hypothetical protein